MNQQAESGAVPVGRGVAVEYASWFKALADATRVQIVSLLARSARPLNVGQIVAAVEVGQSTVSAHLKVLAEVRFVLVEERGTARYYRINDACVACFPTVADVVMGRGVPPPPTVAEAVRKPATPAGVVIRPMRAGDATQVLAIYQAGLDTGEASFETSAPDWATFNATKLPRHRYVAVDASGVVLGWVAATAVSTRSVYAGVVEHSVYVHPDHRRRAIGAALLDALIDSTESARIWTIQTGVFPDNRGSMALHQRAGFRTVGIRQRIGQHHGRWRDVILLERRRAG